MGAVGWVSTGRTTGHFLRPWTTHEAATLRCRLRRTRPDGERFKVNAATPLFSPDVVSELALLAS